MIFRLQCLSPSLAVLSSSKPTEQSTTHSSYYSFYGVDEDSYTCTYTEFYTNSWWMLDFEKAAVVIEVTILFWLFPVSRDFNIRVGNQRRNATNPFCLEHASKRFAGTTTWKCTYAIRGRYLYIEQNIPKAPLTFCEVVVYGYYLD